VPAVPEGKLDVVIASGDAAAATESVTVTVAVLAGELESFTLTLMEKLPLAVGVPETIPVLAPRASPAGRLPDVIDHA